MAKLTTAGAAPVAPHVDPAQPVPPGDHVTKTQDPVTLNQQDRPVSTDADPVTQNDQSPVLTKNDDDKALPGNGSTDTVETVRVRTKENIVLMDPFSTKHIDRDGADVPVTSFINDELAEGGRLEKA